MAIVPLGAAMRQIGRLFDPGLGATAGLGDGPLLARFLDRRDPAAFEALVARHGPMVLAVCRGVLRDPHAAEDAFQATFLILVKKAASIRGREALGGWLHKVAHRTATRAGRGAARRKAVEAEAGTMIASKPGEAAGPWDEFRPVLHEEIARLPERYRLAVVLCDLEGLPQGQAATQLNWSERTLRRRLASARSLLGSRLGRRGIAPTAAPLGFLLAREARASVPAACLEATVRAATVAAAHGSAAGAAGLLAEEVLRTMWYTKVKLAAVALLGVGAATWAGAAFIPEGPKAAPEAPRAPAAGQEAPEPQKADAADTITIRGRVVDPDGKPHPGAAVYVSQAAVKPSETGQQATAGPDGRFEVMLDKAASDNPARGPSWRWATIGAYAPGYSPAWVVAGEVGGRDVDLRLLADDSPIRGRIVDPQGRPIAGATVGFLGISDLREGFADAMLRAGRLDNSRVRSPFGILAWHGALTKHADGRTTGPVETTGPDGRFEIRGVGRDRVVCLNIDGPGLEHAQVYAMARPMPSDVGPRPAAPRYEMADGRQYTPPLYAQTFDHVAGPSKPIVGTVRSKATGKPVSGVAIYATVVATRAFANTKTDAEGRYRLVGLPKAESYLIYATPGAGSPVLGADTTAVDTEGLKPIQVDFDLPRGIVVRGRLIEKGTGRPVPVGNVLYLKLPTNLAEGGGSGSATPSPAGGFTLSVPPGGGMILAEARGTTVPYTRARLLPADKGKGLGGPGDGETSMTMMDAFHAYKIIDIPADATTFGVNLEATPGGTRKGRLVDEAGKEVAGAQAYGLVADWTVKTLEGGDFEAVGLEPGRERLAVFSHRGLKLAGSAVVQPGGGPVEVKMVPCGTAVGRLVDEDGLPMAGVELRSNPIGSDGDRLPGGSGIWPEGERVATDKDGRFRVEGIHPALGLNVEVSIRAKPGTFLTTGGVLDRIKSKAGETVDLGDVRVTYMAR